MAFHKYFKSSLCSAKDSGISELVTCERSLCSCIAGTDRATTTEDSVNEKAILSSAASRELLLADMLVNMVPALMLSVILFTGELFQAIVLHN